ncbi:Protein of unknown function [Lachnospiraceae bacterium]|nr:Protein of unknown function [Lachnospiraceae bacterium]
MTEQAFLTELSDALRGSVSSQIITENVRYYEEYIETEKRKGRSEEEVIESLGNPRLLAKTIIETSDPQNLRGASYEEWKDEEEKKEEKRKADEERAKILTGWKATLAMIAVPLIAILVLVLIIFLVGSFIVFLAPALVVIAVAWLVFRMFNS